MKSREGENVPDLQTAFPCFANLRLFGAFAVHSTGVLPSLSFIEYHRKLEIARVLWNGGGVYLAVT